jgi:hypothetical protein
LSAIASSRETASDASSDSVQAGAADPQGRLRPQLAGTPIHPKSLLATDYLNHFNEPAMLLDILADCPESLEDLAAWKPRSYADHFRASGLSYAELAVEAYRLAPKQFRVGFELVVAEMNALMSFALAHAQEAVETGDPAAFARVAADSERLQALVAEAGGIIQGEPSARITQGAIDALLKQK